MILWIFFNNFIFFTKKNVVCMFYFLLEKIFINLCWDLLNSISGKSECKIRSRTENYLCRIYKRHWFDWSVWQLPIDFYWILNKELFPRFHESPCKYLWDYNFELQWGSCMLNYLDEYFLDSKLTKTTTLLNFLIYRKIT